MCLTCQVFKRGVWFQGESLPVSVQRLVTHFSAVLYGLHGHVQDRSWDVSSTSDLKNELKKNLLNCFQTKLYNYYYNYNRATRA